MFFTYEDQRQEYKKLISLILTLITLVLLLSGCQDITESKYKNAQSLMAKGHYSEAAKLFDELGSYEESTKLSMYCKAASAGESGDYETSFSTFKLLGDYKDSEMMIIYYQARQAEPLDNAEIWDKLDGWYNAANIYDSIFLFRDSKERAESCRKSMYDQGVFFAEAGDYYSAGIIFESISSYKDCDSLSKYCKACYLETNGQYRAASSAFQEVGNFKDAEERVKKALEKGYAAAVALEKEGEIDLAYKVFMELGDYKDSFERACKPYYERGEHLLAEGKYLEASRTFAKVYNYEDALKKSWNIRYKYLKEYQAYAHYSVFVIGEDGKVISLYEPGSKTGITLANKMQDPVVALSYNCALKPDGSVAFYYDGVNATAKNEEAQKLTDIVQIDADYMACYGLKTDGTVVHCVIREFDNDLSKQLSDWTGIVKIQCGQTKYGSTCVYGLRFDGTVLCAEKGKSSIVCYNAVDIEFAKTSGYGGNLFCLLANGDVRCYQKNDYKDGNKWISGWHDIEYICAFEDGIAALNQNGNWLIGNQSYKIPYLSPDTAIVTGHTILYVGIKKNGDFFVAYSYEYNGKNQEWLYGRSLSNIGNDSVLQ